MSCQSKHGCKCNVPFMIKDDIVPIMKLVAKEYRDYKMDNPTKCLNTGVTLLHLILGKHGVKLADYCDTDKTYERHKTLEDSNVSVMHTLHKHVLNKKHRKRYLYYVLLTDGYFLNKNKEQVYFPGHVMLIEKNYDEDTNIPYYCLYQSYINKYDLKGHFDNMNNDVEMTYHDMEVFLAKFTYVMFNGHWDDRCRQYWYDITKVDTKDYLNCDTKDIIYLCFQKHVINSCLGQVKQNYILINKS